MKKVFYFTILSVFFLMVMFYNNYCKRVSASTEIFYKGGNIIYNSISGDICSLNLETGKAKKIIQNRVLISAYDYILCKNNNYIEIFDYNGKNYDLAVDFNIKYGEVHNDDFYYIDAYSSDSTSLKKLNIKTKKKTEYKHINTSSFHVNDNKIYYENDNSIYSYDLYELVNEKVYTGQYCYFFCAERGNLYLSDYSRGNKLIIISDEGINEISKIQTVQFCVDNDTIYYINAVSEAEKGEWRKRKRNGVIIQQYEIS